MILGDSSAQVELLASPLGDGDVVVTIRAHVRDFAGAVETVVTGSQWSAFMRSLQDLERQRQGAAELIGVNHDLRLWIGSTSPAGHMAVRGELRDASVPEGSVLLLRFGPLGFDPSALPALLAELSAAPPAV